ncbi:hypothetical protein ABZ606_15030 [Streptomyces sp. NPDC012461]
MITEYQQKLRERCLAATVVPAPEPWPRGRVLAFRPGPGGRHQ